MRTKISCSARSVIALMLIVGWFSVSPSRVEAQSTRGQKAVYSSSNSVTPSTVWVDASAFWTSGALDMCTLLQNNVFTPTYGTTYSNGAVIDARGLVNASNSTACSVDPFDALSGPPPSTTLLLPNGYIDIMKPWTVPNNTRIVGDEQGTRIRANFSESYMIQMGGTEPTSNKYLCPTSGAMQLPCTSVGLEHIFLDGSLVVKGKEYVVGGINNQYAGAGSYVNDINLWQLSLTGLYVGAGAANSGPYSNISYVAQTSCVIAGCPNPECIDLEAQTQGVHGVTCIGNQLSAATQQVAGILVNASNNSIEDVHIEAFWDGIQVGPSSSATVANVLLSNITGTTTGSGETAAPTTNTVHLCGANPWGPSGSPYFGKCANHGTVQDITILQSLNGSQAPTTTIADDVSGNAIPGCDAVKNPGCPAPISTAIYVLGELDPGAAGVYSKFTSSPATPNGNYSGESSFVPTWGVGSPSTALTNEACSPVGAIYSQVNAGTGAPSVYVCKPTGVWHSIP